MRVLVIEDDALLSQLFEDFLVELGHTPEVVRSAEAGLSALHEQRPDLVLLDIQLPGMSGLEFLQLPAVRESRVPIVVVSGVATEHQARACLRLGALDFVAKPVPLDHLAQILACFEPDALSRRDEMAGRSAERRASPRARVTLPVHVVEYDGREWDATSVDLGVGGIKVRPATAVRPGPAAELTLLPPDEPEALRVLSLLIRIDVDGYAFYFLNLTDAQLDRLQNLVRRLTFEQPP